MISFLDDSYPNGKGSEKYDVIVRDFLIYKKNRLSSNDERISHFETAVSRANKAIQYEKEGKHIEASEEWRKVFDSSMFPKAKENEEREQDVYKFSTAPKPWSY